jgi:hypothetical protein
MLNLINSVKNADRHNPLFSSLATLKYFSELLDLIVERLCGGIVSANLFEFISVTEEGRRQQSWVR